MPRHYRQLAHLGETLYGGVFLCQVSSSSPETSSHERLAVLKLVDLRCAMAMLNTCPPECDADNTLPTTLGSSSSCGRGLDDPRQEKAVANLLRRTGGHPHVVQYLDDMIVDGVLYFVMEFCPGGDLYAYVNRSENQSYNQADVGRPATSVAPLEALVMTREIASGLQFLHVNQIAHRDLSLENVLLQDGVCKIADFGLSTRATRRCTEKVGKAYYMAPEVAAATGGIDSVAYDPKAADMWSLGIVLFILLTGSPLVPSASAEDKAFYSFQRVGLFGVLNAWGMHHIPHKMCNLLNGLLQVNPADRYTVDQVLEHEAFSLLLENEQVEEMDTEQQMQRTPSMSCHKQEESQLQQQRRTRRSTRRTSVDLGFTSSLIET